MTLSQGYQMVQAARQKHPCLDYPYLGIPDEDEDEDEIDKPYAKEKISILS